MNLLEQIDLVSSEPNWQLKARFSEVLHLCSVIPFQLKMDGKEEVALMCYAKGVEDLNEIFEQLKSSIDREAIPKSEVININTESDYSNAGGIFEG